MFAPSSHTLSPRAKGLYLVPFIRRSCAAVIACLASSLACSTPAIRASMSGLLVILFGWCAHGVYPMSKSNGVFFVVLCGHEFLTYCARGSHEDHASCFVPQYSRRYCSSD